MPRANAFREREHDVDFCVIGGGMSGLCAALAAARRGASVVLMHDRPVLGGNASSECRMHICGADRHGQRPYLRETGILEELRLENHHRNAARSYSVWDTLLWQIVRAEPNLTLLLNCSCFDAEMDGSRIGSVAGWQLTTQTYQAVRARLFADCSGDAILAPLTGAAFRMGREAREEYGESLAPEKADRRTMGMTCLFQARPHDVPQPFEPPPWAYRFDSPDDLPGGGRGCGWLRGGYWWIELGGEQDAIQDTEAIRDELLRIVHGVWDFIKNRSEHAAAAENWALDWVQFLPGKRESRRYVGAHVLTQNDIEAEGRFDDIVAYGGWTMDDHNPAGFWAARLNEPATIFHEAPSPYGIPYRCLYHTDVSNLMFAGRCHSASHMAMSSTRVMGTCAAMGQAVGTAAAMACAAGLEPAGMLDRMGELQQALLRDDVYLPWVPRKLSDLNRGARLTTDQGDPEPVRDGVGRQVGDASHAWVHVPGDRATYEFDAPRRVAEVTLLLDTALERELAMSHHLAPRHPFATPDVTPLSFRIEGRAGGEWCPLANVGENHQRLVRVPVDRELSAVRYTLARTHGADRTRLYGFYLD